MGSYSFVSLDIGPACNRTDELPGARIAGHPHSQPNPRYRCFLPDLTEFTGLVIERDPAIAAPDRVRSTLLGWFGRVNHPHAGVGCDVAERAVYLELVPRPKPLIYREDTGKSPWSWGFRRAASPIRPFATC